ncbi:hypothetical protein [Reichenbachiella sp.]|uniref:hypothetical protein n=1 Tax=Reichenbachiella sp. TaxID=2184521 RepID=UPI003BB21C31
MKSKKQDEIELYNSDLFDELLDSISPIESKKIEYKMALAAKLDDAIKAKGWRKKDLLQALGKENPSIITKWLSGTHNFTTDTLIELGEVLDTNFLNIDLKIKPPTITYRIEVSQEYSYPTPDNFYYGTLNERNTIIREFFSNTEPVEA